MTQPLPKFQGRTDYQKYLHVLKKNHYKAIEYLKNIRGKSAEHEKSGKNGFISFQDSVLGGLNLESVAKIDKGKFFKKAKCIVYEQGEPFHRMNSILDAVINQMGVHEPIEPPRSYGVNSQPQFNVKNIQQQGQSQEQSQSVAIRIAIETITVIERKIGEYEKGTPERNFLEKLKENLNRVRTISQLISMIVQTAASVGLSLDKIKEIFS